MRILHIGDLHFWTLPRNPFTILNKRTLGVGNLILGGRFRRFRQENHPSLIQRLTELSPDLFLFSGDISTTALASEFKMAATALRPAVFGKSAFAVPGNHDGYIRAELGAQTMKAAMEPAISVVGEHARIIQPSPKTLVLAINATASNGLLGSHGLITLKHLQVALELEARCADSDIRQVLILCHFPPETPAPLLKHQRGLQLLDAKPLLEIIARLRKPTLWLHGHDHYRWIYGSPTIPTLHYLNGGAPMMRMFSKAPDLGFHEINVEPGSTTLTTHSFDGEKWNRRPVSYPAAGEFFDLQKPA